MHGRVAATGGGAHGRENEASSGDWRRQGGVAARRRQRRRRRGRRLGLGFGGGGVWDGVGCGVSGAAYKAWGGGSPSRVRPD